MDASATDKIKQILDALASKALSQFKGEVRKIYAAGEYREFVPQIVINDVGRAAEINVFGLLGDAVSQVSAISTTPAAFASIDLALTVHLSNLEALTDQGNGVPLNPAMLKVVSERFEATRSRLDRQVENHRPSFVEPKNKGGRAAKWDWEGALNHLVKIANTPDGLRSGYGAQAQIEQIIQDWFIQTYGDSPVESEIRKRASEVMKKAGN